MENLSPPLRYLREHSKIENEKTTAIFQGRESHYKHQAGLTLEATTGRMVNIPMNSPRCFVREFIRSIMVGPFRFMFFWRFVGLSYHWWVRSSNSADVSASPGRPFCTSQGPASSPSTLVTALSRGSGGEILECWPVWNWTSSNSHIRKELPFTRPIGPSVWVPTLSHFQQFQLKKRILEDHSFPCEELAVVFREWCFFQCCWRCCRYIMGTSNRYQSYYHPDMVRHFWTPVLQITHYLWCGINFGFLSW